MVTKFAIIGSGNIVTDLMIRVARLSRTLEMAAFVGIDPVSDGLERAARLGVPVTAGGIDGLLAMPCFGEVALVFDATSAGAHARHDVALRARGKRVVDLTPAALGPYVVPAVNFDRVRDERNVNVVTSGGQATIPIVAAVARVAPVPYAEIAASIASRSAGPGPRANIDEFTETTARAVEAVGGAARGKAIIVLKPAEPPLTMRDTVFYLCEPASEDAIRAAVEAMVVDVQAYVPGYRLKQAVQFEDVPAIEAALLAPGRAYGPALKPSVSLEVEGAAHYLPAYAGSLDIMMAAALRTAERLVGQDAAAVAA